MSINLLPVTHDVPYYSQWESAALVPEFVSGARAASADPSWRTSGANSPEEYAFWAHRMCGVACLRMALQHWRGEAPASVPLALECAEAGAYVLRDGEVEGLIYAPFVAYVRRRFALGGAVRAPLPDDEIRQHLSEGRLVMLSVHKSVRILHPAPPRRGGHLVLAVGATPESLLVHNPSGFPGTSQRFAEIPWDDLGRFYAGRGVVLASEPWGESNA
jgi:hypothetical protein